VVFVERKKRGWIFFFGGEWSVRRAAQQPQSAIAYNYGVRGAGKSPGLRLGSPDDVRDWLGIGCAAGFRGNSWNWMIIVVHVSVSRT
jgi:hypothetical protein